MIRPTPHSRNRDARLFAVVARRNVLAAPERLIVLHGTVRALEVEDGLGRALVLLVRVRFSYDFGVTIDESVTPARCHFRTKTEYEAMGSDFFKSDQPFEMPGRSCFLQVEGRSESARSATPDFAS